MHVTPIAWIFTLALLAALLALDWVRLGRHPHEVGLGEALRWSLFYIAVALLFGVGLGMVAGWDLATQYFAGYVVEKSLSIDNLFVFAIIIASFAVPAEQQPRLLTIGIVIALMLRAVFIALGAALLSTFAFMFLVFGLALVATAVQLYRHRDQDPSTEDNALVAAARRRLPISDRYEGGRIIVRRDGRRTFTPLFLALLAIGSTDLLFAFDSIPAVFGVTRHAYIVFAANAFALLGLRALYFLVSDLLRRLIYLSTGLAAVLAFIGIKLVLEFVHHQAPSVPALPTALSLAIIAAILAITTIASMIGARRDPGALAHAGGVLRARDRQTDGAVAKARVRPSIRREAPAATAAPARREEARQPPDQPPAHRGSRPAAESTARRSWPPGRGSRRRPPSRP